MDNFGQKMQKPYEKTAKSNFALDRFPQKRNFGKKSGHRTLDKSGRIWGVSDVFSAPVGSTPAGSSKFAFRLDKTEIGPFFFGPPGREMVASPHEKRAAGSGNGGIATGKSGGRVEKLWHHHMKIGRPGVRFPLGHGAPVQCCNGFPAV